MNDNLILHLPLFVYGTLRPGERYHNRLLGDRVNRIEPAQIRALLFHHLAGDYPCLLHGEGTVTGELVWIHPEIWPRLIAVLDRFEEYSLLDVESSMYRREQVEARLASGEAILAWTYVWNQPELPGPAITSGDWRSK